MSTREMTTELFRQLAIVSEDESMMKRAIKALQRITKPKEDHTLMTKEEFFKQVEEAEKQIERGEGVTFTNSEDMNKWLNAL
ncbi:MAG: hypothetical protein IJR20_03060 [Muribaculaceae bacterium]|nr:hypothetical protein [Muribaculaceae bacterium]